MKIRDILEGQSTRPIVVRRDQNVIEAARILAERNIGALVVVDEAGAIAGVISERDIAYAVGTMGDAAVGCTVAELMTSSIITIRPDETVEDAVYVFKAGLFRHLIVADRGKAVGVLSIRDIVRNLAPLLLEAKGRIDDQKMSSFLRALSAH
jgi:CBS domain-containing protein